MKKRQPTWFTAIGQADKAQVPIEVRVALGTELLYSHEKGRKLLLKDAAERLKIGADVKKLKDYRTKMDNEAKNVFMQKIRKKTESEREKAWEDDFRSMLSDYYMAHRLEAVYEDAAEKVMTNEGLASLRNRVALLPDRSDRGALQVQLRKQAKDQAKRRMVLSSLLIRHGFLRRRFIRTYHVEAGDYATYLYMHEREPKVTRMIIDYLSEINVLV